MTSVSKKKGVEPRRGSARSTALRPSASARWPPELSRRRRRPSGRSLAFPPSALSLSCSLESPIGRYGARKPFDGRSRPSPASGGSHLPLSPPLSLFLSSVPLVYRIYRPNCTGSPLVRYDTGCIDRYGTVWKTLVFNLGKPL